MPPRGLTPFARPGDLPGGALVGVRAARLVLPPTPRGDHPVRNVLNAMPLFWGPLDPCPPWCVEPAGHDAHEASSVDGSATRFHLSAWVESVGGVWVRAYRVVHLEPSGASWLIGAPGVDLDGDLGDDPLTTDEVRRYTADQLAAAALADGAS